MKKYRFVSLLLFVLLSVVSGNLFSQLYFSEYIEGSSYNKALEIYNPGPEDIDLSADLYSIELYYNGNTSPNMTIALGGILLSGDVFVVAASNVNGVNFPLDQVDLFYGTSWFNGDDAIILLREGVVVDSIGQIGHDPGSQWGSGDISTQDNTLRRLGPVTQGDVDPYDSFDPSLSWAGFPNDSFDNLGSHGAVATSTPVLTPESTPSPAPQTIGIYDIQGQGHQSPYTGQSVSTIGVITLVDDSGFYLQDALGDGDNKTSDAIYVYSNSVTYQIGDEVLVQGSISEYVPGGSSTGNLSTTEFYRPVITLLSSGNPLPAPVIIGINGRMPPTELIDDDGLMVFDPENEGIDFYESMEAMIVQVEDAMALSPINSYDEVFVVANQGSRATNINSRKGITITPGDYNPERVQIQLKENLLPGFRPQINTGDLLGNPRGVLSYNFGNYEILADQGFSLDPAMLEKEMADFQGNAQRLTIATYNVENLDPNDGDGDSDLASGKFTQIAGQVVNHLLSPDIIALQEIQDNDGAVDSGEVDASHTYETLISEIISAGGPAYLFLDSTPENNKDGGQPGANIRVGYLYNPARVNLVPGSVKRIGEEVAFFESRKSLAAAFTFNGHSLVLINNHFASKGGSTPLFGQVQPYINGNLEQREAQAQAINDYVDNLLLLDPEAKVVVLGDLNEFSFYSPLEILKGEDQILFDAITCLPVLEQFSYNFQGNAQALDHILVTNNLSDLLQIDALHINSEFASQSSDHDPLMLSLELPKAPVYQPGDVNHDHKVNIVDVLLLAKYLSGHEVSPFYMEQSDMNQDNKIDFKDILKILWYVIRY
ncbi:MAG: lamin tail domain-containing protein [Spirochaetales bacterium]|nr:lamin tail domain-containing protein [Spirochaetales bacterium]